MSTGCGYYWVVVGSLNTQSSCYMRLNIRGRNKAVSGGAHHVPQDSCQQPCVPSFFLLPSSFLLPSFSFLLPSFFLSFFFFLRSFCVRAQASARKPPRWSAPVCVCVSGCTSFRRCTRRRVHLLFFSSIHDWVFYFPRACFRLSLVCPLVFTRVGSPAFASHAPILPFPGPSIFPRLDPRVLRRARSERLSASTGSATRGPSECCRGMPPSPLPYCSRRFLGSQRRGIMSRAVSCDRFLTMSDGVRKAELIVTWLFDHKRSDFIPSEGCAIFATVSGIGLAAFPTCCGAPPSNEQHPTYALRFCSCVHVPDAKQMYEVLVAAPCVVPRLYLFHRSDSQLLSGHDSRLLRDHRPCQIELESGLLDFVTT